MRAFIASLFAAAAFANHEAQEMAAIGLSSAGYALNVWAVTGKLDFESQNIDTWYFGAELTTPVGDNRVYSTSASAKDLGADSSDAYTYVGNNGEVYQTYVQFQAPDYATSSNFESFTCSRMLTVDTENEEFMIEDEEGYKHPRTFPIVTETVGPAEVQNFFGQRNFFNDQWNTDNAYNNQLVAENQNRVPSNQVTGDANQIWYSESQINTTVFLQQGYKNGTRKYNCVAQRAMDNSKSVFPTLEAGTTKMDFMAGYKIYPSATAAVNSNLNLRSAVLSVTVMDGAMNLAAGVVVAAATLLAF